jgi:hypothetical protein
MNMDHIKTVEQVDEYRREMASYYHPDKWPADKQKDANEIMKVINANCDKRRRALRWEALKQRMSQ